MGKKWVVLTTVPVLLAAGVILAGKLPAKSDWAVKGSWTDACCCRVSCPCLFGSKPTEGYCQGASLVEIDKGHHGDVELDGVSAIVTYQVGGWSKIVVSDTASEEKVAAMGALLPKVLPFLSFGEPPSVEAAPLVVQRQGDTVRYSVPQTSVELTMVRGANGEPVRVHNLPAKGSPFPQAGDHTQYKSEHLRHESGDQSFSWSGRNGLTATLDLSGPAADS